MEGLVLEIFVYSTRLYLACGVGDLLQRMSPFGYRLLLGSLEKEGFGVLRRVAVVMGRVVKGIKRG